MKFKMRFLYSIALMASMMLAPGLVSADPGVLCGGSSVTNDIGASLNDGTEDVYSGDCSATLGCEDYFDLYLGTGEVVLLSTCGADGGSADFDTALSVWSGASFDTLESCVDDTCGLQTQLPFQAPAAGFYRFKIGSFFGLSEGTYELAYDLTRRAPAVNDTIRFRTTKAFIPTSATETVDLEINCNTGTILTQEYELGDGGVVEFVVENFNPGDDIFCEITESGSSDYDAAFVANSGLATGGSSCLYEGDQIRRWNLCEVTNTAKPATLTVYKEWDYAGVDPADIVDDVWVFVECTDVIVAKPSGGIYYDSRKSVKVLVEGEDDFDVDVDMTDGAASCRVYEEVYDSAIEPDEGCQIVRLSINGSASCTLNNAVFFEGIPTLSQYGLAIMALLMLGVGFVGFRRFI